MKIGIMSDSHNKIGRSKKVIKLLKMHGAKQIIHAGDIVKLEVLELLKISNIPYIAVYGNNDAHLYKYNHDYNLVKQPFNFTIKDISLSLMHHPSYISYDTDVVIYGHTHIFDARYINNTLILNPGESCAREKLLSECILLNIKKKYYKVSYFNRSIKTATWVEKKIYFERSL